MLLENDRPPLTATIHQPEFLPWLGWIDKVRQCDVFVLLDSVQYEKNYFQNRNRIRSANGSTWLTVPVLTKGFFGQTIRDVKIQNDETWRRKHVQSIKQNYSSAPFFDRYFPDLQNIYEAATDNLAELNIAAIEWIVGAFGLKSKFIRSSQLGVTGKRSELLANLCLAVGASRYLSGISGKDYLDPSYFHSAQVIVQYQEFNHPIYKQCYEPFMPQMSSIDLLFNAGPQALQVLAEANPSRVHAR
jgi:hypothetical protein